MPKWLFSLPLWLYMGIILAVNIGFSYVPMIITPIGAFSPMAIVVGTVFVARDYAQRQIGHYIWFGMIVGTILSFVLADPFVAAASAAAFLISEVVDWAIFTITKKPFGQRVLVSSAIATPVDTAVFLLGISAFGWGTFMLMILSKMVASVFIWMVNRDIPTIIPDSNLPQIAGLGSFAQGGNGGRMMAVVHNPDGTMDIPGGGGAGWQVPSDFNEKVASSFAIGQGGGSDSPMGTAGPGGKSAA